MKCVVVILLNIINLNINLIKSNFSKENVEIIIFERIRGIVHTGTIDLHSNREISIETPWGQGVYTIIFKINNGFTLKGDFIILQ